MDEKQAASEAWKKVVGLNGAEPQVIDALREAVRAEIRYQTGMAKWDSPGARPASE